MDLETIKSKYNKLVTKREVILDNIKSNTKELERNKDLLQTVEKAQAFVQSVAQVTQKQLSEEIDGIVNLALQTMFPGQYKLHLDYVISRGKTESRFMLYDKSGAEIDPMGAMGGGVVDVIAMSLRIALYALTNYNNVLIFDEPCRFVSADLRERMSDLIKVFADKVGCQIIMITHIKEFENNANVIRVRKEKGKSRIVSNN